MKNDKTYTLITGASAGLGKEMAIYCAKRGKNLILIALPGRNLHEFCHCLRRTYGVDAICFEGDLTHKEQLLSMASKVLGNYQVDMLINNAGMGGTCDFDDASIEYLDAIIQLNIRATVMMCRLFLQELQRHPGACILNVSSLTAFSPIPHKTVYPASKAFVYSFSRGLSRELKDTNVRVFVLMPGAILTNPDVSLRIFKQGFKGRFGLLPAREITRIAFASIKKGKEVIVPGVLNKLNHLMLMLIPEKWRLAALDRLIGKEIEETIKVKRLHQQKLAS